MEQRTFLIVDSKATSVFYTASLLRRLRYIVRSVGSGEDALEMVAQAAPTCVITDTALPRMSGLDLLKRMKGNASLRFIPVIVNTADDSTAMRDACLAAGCAGYFVKPIAPDSLYQAIQAASEATPRKNIRITTALKARLASGPEGRPRTEEVTSLSIGGLYVKTAFPEPVMATVSLTLLVGSREIAATAVVLYSSEKAGGKHAVPGMGLKFTESGSADVQRIGEFIRAELMKDLGDLKA